MKSNTKNKLITYLLVAGLFSFQVGCSTSGNREIAAGDTDYDTVSGTSVNGGEAADFSTTEITTTSASDIRTKYENFVSQVQANKDTYTKEQWQSAENYFKALDDRKDAINSELTDDDKDEIIKAKAKYTAIKAGRLGIDASEAGNEAIDATKTGAQKVGNAAEKVGSEVKYATKTGAKKVGNTAEKIGSEVKSTVKKVPKR